MADPTTERTEERRDLVRADRVLAALAIAVIAFVLGNILMYRYGRDQGIYAVVAEAMRQGGAPYRDAWDFKPPGIFLVYRLSRLVFGSAEWGIRATEVLALSSLVWAYVILSRRVFSRALPGLLGAACAIVIHGQLEFWHTAQPESFGGVLLAWAIVLSTWEPGASAPRGASRELGAWVGAGALYAAAALLKPPLGGGFVVSLAFVAVRVHARTAEGSRARAVGRLVGAFALGGALPVALTFVYFAAKGALHDLYDTLFVFTPYYTKLSFERRWLWAFIYYAFEQLFTGLSSFIPVGVLLFLGLRETGRGEKLFFLHVGGVVVVQLVGIALQAKFFPYHYGAALPLAALLAGMGAYKLWERVRWGGYGLPLFVAATWLTSEGRGATRDLEDKYWDRCKLRVAMLFDHERARETEDHLYSVADVNSGANRDVAAWIAEHTAPSDKVFIWGFEPEIYDLAGRRWASRYIYNVPQRVAWAASSRELLVRELRESPPAVLVVEHRDVFPMVTGNSRDSHDSIAYFPEFEDFLHGGYKKIHRIEDFDLYVPR